MKRRLDGYSFCKWYMGAIFEERNYLQMKYKKKILFVFTTFMLTFGFLFAACQPEMDEPVATPTPVGLPGTGEMLPEEGFPSMEVNDQEVRAGTVSVAEVINPGNGWIVIYADDNGSLGPIIGLAHVIGSSLDVRVDIDTTQATETLHAVLHEDRGMIGEFEFPGTDVPAEFNGQFVIETFRITGVDN
jgi:hypothetical protein